MYRISQPLCDSWVGICFHKYHGWISLFASWLCPAIISHFWQPGQARACTVSPPKVWGMHTSTHTRTHTHMHTQLLLQSNRDIKKAPNTKLLIFSKDAALETRPIMCGFCKRGCGRTLTRLISNSCRREVVGGGAYRNHQHKTASSHWQNLWRCLRSIYYEVAQYLKWAKKFRTLFVSCVTEYKFMIMIRLGWNVKKIDPAAAKYTRVSSLSTRYDFSFFWHNVILNIV